MSKTLNGEFLCAEDAVQQDIAESKYVFKKLASWAYPTKSIEQGQWLLRKKLSGDSRSTLGLQETIGLLKISECAENTIRYFCYELGYEMPIKKAGAGDARLVAEEEIMKIDDELKAIHENCTKKIDRRNELVEKLNRVRKDP